MLAEAAERRDPSPQRLAQDPAEGVREGIVAFYDVFGDHRAVTLAGADARVTSAEVRALWTAVMETWVAEAAEAIEAERARGAAPEGVPARDLATALVGMNERALHATFAGHRRRSPRRTSWTRSSPSGSTPSTERPSRRARRERPAARRDAVA
jgi:hypothetical protein